MPVMPPKTHWIIVPDQGGAVQISANCGYGSIWVTPDDARAVADRLRLAADAAEAGGDIPDRVIETYEPGYSPGEAS